MPPRVGDVPRVVPEAVREGGGGEPGGGGV